MENHPLTTLPRWYNLRLRRPLPLPSFYSYSGLTTAQFSGKWYPILDQNLLISIPFPRLNCLKTIPFTAAHTYVHVAHIWECPGTWTHQNNYDLAYLCKQLWKESLKKVINFIFIFPGYIKNPFNDQLPVGLLAQLGRAPVSQGSGFESRHPRGVLRLVNDGDDRRIFWGLKFSIPGFFWVGKFGKEFFGWIDLNRGFSWVLKTN